MRFQHRLFTYLRDNEVPFTIQYLDEAISTLPAPTARARGNAPLVRVDLAFVGGQLTMLAIRDDHQVEPALLRTALRRTDVTLVDFEWLAAAFPDVEIDAIPPLGVLWQIPVLADAGLAGEQAIRFFAGSRHDIVTLRRVDLDRLTQPTTLDFAVPVVAEKPVLAYEGVLETVRQTAD